MRINCSLFALLAFIFLAPHLSVSARDIKIQVAATADVHARLFPYNFIENKPAATSMANIHTITEVIRAREGSNLILLDNGDLMQGTPAAWYANFVQEADENLFSRVMNFMKFDAATIGNHDIETGPAVYNRVKEEFNFPWLGANVLDAETGEPYFQPYVIIKRNHIRIAVLGLTTTGVPNWLPPHLWEGLAFQDMVEAARYWVDYINEHEKPDALIGLFHSGLGPLDAEPDAHPLEHASGYVARHVPGFDLIISSHDHRRRIQTVVNVEGDNVLVLGPGHFAEHLAIAELTFNRVGRRQYELKNVRADMLAADEVVPSHTFIRKFEKDVDEIIKFSNRKVSYLKEPMHSMEAWFGSAAFADMVHDIQLSITDAEISFTAPLAFDATIKAGPLRMREFFKLYEFENYLYVMELSGQEIKDHLEYSYSLWFNEMESKDDHLLNLYRDRQGRVPPDRRGWRALRNAPYNFDSAAGINYIVDVSKPVGERVQIVDFEDGRDFIPEEIYRVAINSYRGSGGGGHLTRGAGIPHEELTDRIVFSTDTDLRKQMIDYFEEIEAYQPEKRGNWSVIPEDWAEAGRKKDMPFLK